MCQFPAKREEGETREKLVVTIPKRLPVPESSAAASFLPVVRLMKPKVLVLLRPLPARIGQFHLQIVSGRGRAGWGVLTGGPGRHREPPPPQAAKHERGRGVPSLRGSDQPHSGTLRSESFLSFKRDLGRGGYALIAAWSQKDRGGGIFRRASLQPPATPAGLLGFSARLRPAWVLPSFLPTPEPTKRRAVCRAAAGKGISRAWARRFGFSGGTRGNRSQRV